MDIDGFFELIGSILSGKGKVKVNVDLYSALS